MLNVVVGAVVAVLAVILSNHDLFVFLCVPHFSLRMTDGVRASKTLTFNHYYWDGERAFAHLRMHPPTLAHSFKPVQGVRFLTDDFWDSRYSHFTNASVEYLTSLHRLRRIKVSVIVSKRHVLYDTNIPGNYFSMTHFYFDPTLTRRDNCHRLKEAVSKEKKTASVRMSPLVMLYHGFTSDVVLDAWSVGDVNTWMIPTSAPYISPHVRRRFVVLAHEPRGWYVRNEVAV